MGLRDSSYEHRRKKMLMTTTLRLVGGGLLGALFGVFLGNLIFEHFSIEAVKNTAALTLLGVAAAQRRNALIYFIPSIVVGGIGMSIGLAFDEIIADFTGDAFAVPLTMLTVIMTIVGAFVGNVIIEFLLDIKVIR